MLIGVTRFDMQIAPALLGGFKRPIKKFAQAMAWLDALAWFSGNHSNDATEDAFDTFYAQSALIPEHNTLSENFVRSYFETMRSAGLDPSQVSIHLTSIGISVPR